MAQGRGPDSRKAGRAPFPRRSRKHWTAAGGVAGAWLFLYLVSGSGFSATVLLATFGALGAIAVLFLRSIGVTRHHPWIRQLASRPWRDGQDVLRVAVRHLPDLFVITPRGAVFAPASVEIQMNPEDLASLCDRMEFAVVIASVTESYEEQVARCGARFVSSERAGVSVVADELTPRGGYRLRQGNSITAGAQREMPDTGHYMSPAPDFGFSVPWYPGAGSDDAGSDGPGSDGWEWREPEPARTGVDARTAAADGQVTVLEKTVPPVPMLRLVTGDSVAQTQMTGARAGRGSVELVLPNVPTISREHARFEFADGRWWVSNLGINGLAVNGAPAVSEHPLNDGDAIRWGSQPNALVSRVEIG
jgi:FHA domain